MLETIKRHIDAVCLLHLALFVFLMVLLSTVMQDRLLFKTDWPTLGFFLFALNFILLLALLPFFFLLWRVLKKRMLALKAIYAGAVTFMVFYSILMNLFNNPFIFQSQSTTRLLLFNLLCIILAAAIATKIADRTAFENIRPVSRWFMLAAFIFIAVAKIHFLTARHETRGPKPKNVILFVMDSLSTPVIREYGGNGPVTIHNVSADYALFENFRTNFTYTYGYFNALFGGRKSAPAAGRGNLFSLLQASGVNTRWLAAQGNAVPDNHAVKNYRGLRSYFFNYRFSRLPAWLGIDYNIYRSPFKKDGPMIYAAHRLIDRFLGHKNDFAAEILGEIGRLSKDVRPFFFLVHQFPACETSRPYKLWEKGSGHGQRERIGEKIRGNDYVYGRDEEWLVREWEEKALSDVTAGFACLEQIHAGLKANGWATDTLFILTADHGKIFDRGKVWYGFHNDEEVARVPLVIFNSTLPKSNPRLGETIDITQTLLENFAVDQRLDPDALSLFADAAKDSVTTLSEYSPVRREQFLNLYRRTAAGIRKYVIDPFKQDYLFECELDGGRNKAVFKTAFADSPLQPEFENAFRAYGMPSKNK